MTIKRAYRYLRRYGFSAFIRKVRFKFSYQYHDEFLKKRVSEEELIRQRQHMFSHRPLISILMPVYNPSLEYLKEAINSVLFQSYDIWQLCIADGGSNQNVQNYLKSISISDPRISLFKLHITMSIYACDYGK